MSGKIYYDIVKERERLQLNDRVALVRIEELSPFPFRELKETLMTYANAKEFLWVQEEPQNQGAWMHVSSRIDEVLDQGQRSKVKYSGRKEAPMPAPGIAKVYTVQQRAVLGTVFQGL